MYVLHSLHVHPLGIHFFIFYLNIFNEVDSYISVGTRSQVFGHILLIVSVQ